jgi:hypothetical protein
MEPRSAERGNKEAERAIDAGILKEFTLNKRKHRLRFEDETEDSVRVVIEPKEKK